MFKKITSSVVVLFCVSVIISGCVPAGKLTSNLPYPAPENGFTNPKLVEVEFTIRIEKVKFFAPDSLRRWNISRGLPSDQPPTLLIWCSDFTDQTNQRIIEKKEPSVQPTETFTDFENGNKILFWNFSQKVREAGPIVIKRRFSYLTYDYKPEIDESKIALDYSSVPDNLYYFYTKSEPLLEQQADLVKMANKITGNEISLLNKAKAIFEWVRRKMKYVYPPEKRGVLEAVKKYEGDCGQYSALYITLCRSLGIPARQQSGFIINDGELGYHVWSEIYMPGLGWLPVDATDPQGFGHLDNKRLITSVGLNIPLKHVPSWANYDDQDVQGNRTDFMQFMTIVKSGFSANVISEKRVIKYNDVKMQ
jgi:transglutaminase-like putative cysteine protease